LSFIQILYLKNYSYTKYIQDFQVNIFDFFLTSHHYLANVNKARD
jgi:hypothetical protein